ncbi:MAG TPA: hypothetical protein VIM70_01590 [Clostridium sp.]|uniref:hypothetical protein n=1 Tax=Clostridium sp. TaxID=1506 RepID=UPI002F92CFBA
MVVKKDITDKPVTKVVTKKKVATKKPAIEKVELIPETQPVQRKPKIQIDRNELIPCRSATYGGLTYISTRTGTTIVWNDFGTTEDVEYGEILTMRASQPKFLTKPWIIIEDEEVVASIRGLAELYRTISEVGENLEDFFQKTPKKIEEILSKAPNGTRVLIADKAREMIDNGTLYDTRIISVIDKIMHTSLKDFIK